MATIGAEDVTPGTIAAALPGRPIRVYPSVVSTEAEAMAWSRAGAEEGAVVVAGYQLAARSRPRRPWRSTPDRSLSFSLVLRPTMPPSRAGILYLAASAGVAEIVGDDAMVAWPDEVWAAGELAAQVSVHREMNVRGLEWALVNVMVTRAEPPRAQLLARVVASVEALSRRPPAELVAAWARRCPTLGKRVLVSLYPIGANRRVEGRAVGVGLNGALRLLLDSGASHAVSPFELASLEVSPD